MSKQLRYGAAALTLLTAFGVVCFNGLSQAGDKGGDLKASVRKIADAIKAGKLDEADKMALAASKKDDQEAVMNLFKPRSKGGLGFGAAPIPKNDGIEMKINELRRDAPASVSKDAAAIEQSGYDTAALALITKHQGPEKAVGKKTPTDWKKWSDDMKDTGIGFAKSAKGGSADVKTAASKLNQSCNACHSVFRE